MTTEAKPENQTPPTVPVTPNPNANAEPNKTPPPSTGDAAKGEDKTVDGQPPKEGEVKPADAPGDKAGDKPKPEDVKPPKVVPEKYDLKLSEGSLADASLTERIAE